MMKVDFTPIFVGLFAAGVVVGLALFGLGWFVYWLAT